jgi:hypothetical protein
VIVIQVTNLVQRLETLAEVGIVIAFCWRDHLLTELHNAALLEHQQNHKRFALQDFASQLFSSLSFAGLRPGTSTGVYQVTFTVNS